MVSIYSEECNMIIWSQKNNTLFCIVLPKYIDILEIIRYRTGTYIFELLY